jgi:L-aminopeptidase/D-esterase-like protein
MKAGIGTASLHAGRLVVSAVVAVNAFGDVIDPDTNTILAGTRARNLEKFLDTSAALQHPVVRMRLALRNTLIGVVATNARLDSAQVNNVAASAHDGLARVVKPSHTLYDGDTIFTLATGTVKASEVLVSSLAAEAVMLAILNGVIAAEPIPGLPSATSFHSKPSRD